MLHHYKVRLYCRGSLSCQAFIGIGAMNGMMNGGFGATRVDSGNLVVSAAVVLGTRYGLARFAR